MDNTVIDQALSDQLQNHSRITNTTSVRLRDEEWQWIKRLAIDRSCTMGEVIRQIIRRARVISQVPQNTKEVNNG